MSSDEADAMRFWPIRKKSTSFSEDVPHVHPSRPPQPPPSSVVQGGDGPGIDDEEYFMKHKYRGKAIIFNHYEFLRNKKSARSGTEVDEKNLKEKFGKLGFNVEVYKNFRKFEVLDVLSDGKLSR